MDGRRFRTGRHPVEPAASRKCAEDGRFRHNGGRRHPPHVSPERVLVLRCKTLAVAARQPQNTKRSFRASTFAASTPVTFFRSSTDLNGPFSRRYFTIASATSP